MELTKEQKRISRKNHKKAVEYFESIGLMPKDRKPYSYILHHTDERLRHDDIERYIQWNVCDLQVLTNEDHVSMHNSGKEPWNKGKTGIYSNEVLKKMRTVKKENYIKENHPNYGKHLKESTKEKISKKHAGVKASEETRKKISCATSGENNPMYGKHQSELSKKKSSESLKKTYQAKRIKRILEYYSGRKCIE